MVAQALKEMENGPKKEMFQAALKEWEKKKEGLQVIHSWVPHLRLAKMYGAENKKLEISVPMKQMVLKMPEPAMPEEVTP
eukprot:6317218-Karenia_brevis.AAC.1